MRRHVIGAFVIVPIAPRLLRRNAIEEGLEVGANVRRGVLLNEQSGRCVPAKQGQQAGVQAVRAEPIQDVARDLDKSAAAGGDRKTIDELPHLDNRCRRVDRSLGNTSVIWALLGRPREQ